MSLEDQNDIKQPTQLFDLGVVGIAAALTCAGIALCFFTFMPPGEKPAPAPQPAAVQAQPGEVTIGIGSGQSIHPAPPTQPRP